MPVNPDEITLAKLYRLTKPVSHNPIGTLVCCTPPTPDYPYVICNPVGEPSMQDSFCVIPETELEEVER